MNSEDPGDHCPAIIWLEDLSPSADATHVGGKALGLVRLLAAGQAVPPAFVITRPALEVGVRHADDGWRLDPALAADIVRAFDRLGADRVAVRSSAPTEDSASHSHAGCHASFLPVDRGVLLDRVVACWRSAAAATAVSYAGGRAALAASPAVIVQRLVDARLSGVSFSRAPTDDCDGVVLECVRGPGDLLVSGEVTPDRYVVSRQPWRIARRELSRQTHVRRGEQVVAVSDALVGAQKLQDPQIFEVAAAAVAIESELGHPVDIEWAYDLDDHLHLLQARPITGATSVADAAARAPCPLQFVWEDVLALWQMDLGVAARGQSSGCLWANQRRFVYFRDGERTSMFAPLAEIQAADAKAAAYHLEAFMDHELRRMEAIRREQNALFRDMDSRRTDYGRMDRRRLGALFERVRSVVAASLQYYLLSEDWHTAALIAHIGRSVPDEGNLLALISAPEPDLTEVERVHWTALNAAGAPSDAELLDHAHRFPWLTVNHHTYEAVLGLLRLRRSEDPAVRADPELRRRALEARQEDLLRRFPHLRPAVAVVHAVSQSRMHMKRGWAGADLYMIPFLTEVCRRSGVERIDVLDGYLVGDIEALIYDGRRVDVGALSERRAAYLWWCEDGAVERCQGADAARRGVEIARSVHRWGGDGTTLRGATACPGRAEGRVLVLSNNEPALLKLALELAGEGTILVSQMIQPNMIDLLQRCVGVITDEGGQLSHAAILAREFGTPCVVGTGSATRLLRTGDRVVITGDGRVELRT
ncbi:MAG: hypothetical protein IPK80_03080 [Nannocystis sp.]|nr:hypothetical protein [Nannocystis sp.]